MGIWVVIAVSVAAPAEPEVGEETTRLHPPDRQEGGHRRSRNCKVRGEGRTSCTAAAGPHCDRDDARGQSSSPTGTSAAAATASAPLALPLLLLLFAELSAAPLLRLATNATLHVEPLPGGARPLQGPPRPPRALTRTLPHRAGWGLRAERQVPLLTSFVGTKPG